MCVCEHGKRTRTHNVRVSGENIGSEFQRHAKILCVHVYIVSKLLYILEFQPVYASIKGKTCVFQPVDS